MLKLWGESHKQTLPNAQRMHGLSTLIKVTAFKSYHKLINIQLQNLNKTSASKSWPNSSFNISTKLNVSKWKKKESETQQASLFYFWFVLLSVVSVDVLFLILFTQLVTTYSIFPSRLPLVWKYWGWTIFVKCKTQVKTFRK